jgi:glucosamine--fructose-6-phosphate aminotransferase (isomerizing)
MTYMLDEIYEQPEVINSLMPQWLEDIAPLAEEVRCRDIRFVYVAARGSSDHAAVYCKYALEIRNKLSVALANPSAFTLYDSAPRFTSDTLVIGISQSGAGPDVVEVVRKARADGALTACIVNTPHSALAAVSEFVLRLGLGREKSVAATKTYTSSIAMAALLSSALSSDVIASQKDIAAAIQAMESALYLDKAAAEAA